jgi:hypothetical protein
MRRLLDAVCEVLEAYAERLRTESLDIQLDAMAWVGNDDDED